MATQSNRGSAWRINASASDTPRRARRRTERALVTRIGVALAARDAASRAAAPALPGPGNRPAIAADTPASIASGRRAGGRAAARLASLERQGVRELKRSLRELEREVRSAQQRAARQTATLRYSAAHVARATTFKPGAGDVARRATR